MTYHLGSTSLKRLRTCHVDIIKIIEEAIAGNPPCDFGVVCGARGKAAQEAAFAGGHSKARYGESPHNAEAPHKALAVDIAPYSGETGYLWNDKEMFNLLAEHVKTTADRLMIKGIITNEIEWGGDWTSFKDMPHWQLTNWKELKQGDGW